MGWRFSARFIITGLALKGLAIHKNGNTKKEIHNQ